MGKKHKVWGLSLKKSLWRFGKTKPSTHPCKKTMDCSGRGFRRGYFIEGGKAGAMQKEENIARRGGAGDVTEQREG